MYVYYKLIAPSVTLQTVAFTFDDGPDCGDDGLCTKTNTENILDILQSNSVTASFFINTDNWGGPIDQIPVKQDVLRRIVGEGHLLGSHTVDHKNLGTLSAAEVETELASVETTVAKYVPDSRLAVSPCTCG